MSRVVIKRIRSVFGLLAMLFGGVVFLTGSVVAEGEGAVIGGGAAHNPSQSGHSGGSSSWLNSYSWIYYEPVNETSGDILFRPDAPLYESVSASEAHANNNPISGECGGRGFWHYGQDAVARYGGNFGLNSFRHSEGGEVYSTSQFTYSTVKGENYGHAFSFDYTSTLGRATGNSWSLNHVLYDNDNPVYRAAYYDSGDGLWTETMVDGKKVKTTRDALEAFKQAYSIKTTTRIEDYPYGNRFPEPDELPVYYFCWWPGMEPEVEYFTKSEVVIDETKEPKTASTGVSDAKFLDGEKAEAEKSGYAEGDTATVKFSPNIYSSQELEEATKWTITREFQASNNFDYEIEVAKGSKESEEKGSAATLKVECTFGSDKYYAEDDCSFLREDEFKITFKTQGELLICEYISIDDKDRQTAACAKLIVNQSNEYLAKSTVAIRGGPQAENIDDTGVTHDGDAYVFENNIDLNEEDGEREVVFSHNIYSKRKIEDIEWELKREGFNGDGYTVIEQELCPTPWYNNNLANFREYEIGSDDIYFGEPQDERGRACENGGWKYIVREVYKIKLTVAPKTYEFCEEVYVDGLRKTRVCAALSTKIDIPGGCAQWAPDSYYRSDEYAGWTSVVAKIKNTSIGDEWMDSTYAKPDDDIDWAFCYYPGVQKTAGTLATNNHINESAGHPDDDYSLTYMELYKFGSPWQNFYKLYHSGKFTPRFTGKGESRGIGDSSMLEYFTDEEETTYRVERGLNKNKAGEVLYGWITSGIPTYASVSNMGPHSWKCHWHDEDCDECGSYSCNCVTTTNDDGTTSKDCDTCCHSCYADICKHTEDYIAHSISNVAAKDNAFVKVPYNFINTATVNQKNDPVFAGEITELSDYTVSINVKHNDVTHGDYITQVDDAKIELVAYVSTQNSGSAMDSVGDGRNYDICSALSVYSYESCIELDEKDGFIMNPEGRMTTTRESFHNSDFNKEYSVFDTEAGKYFCVVAAVYPANSGEDTNLSASGNNKWYVSAPSCRIIAKRPSFQVRGGSTYSSDSISTSTSNKNNVRGVYGYTPTNRGLTVVFGSWAEESVVANGIVTGFASGAASGLAGSIEGLNPKYCDTRVPISFANYTNLMGGICPHDAQVGQLGVTINGGKDDISNYWLVTNPVSVSGDTANLAIENSGYVTRETLQGDKVRYTYKSGNLKIMSTDSIGAGTTHIVRVDGNISIESDLLYRDGETYNSIQYIPKMVIYSKGNINISCDVNRIDAILAAEGTVNTCADVAGNSPDINDPARSRQLVINGAVLTNKLVLGRTYGAGAGRASGIPAEIINYDPTAVLWGRKKAEGDASNTMMTVYQHELAPRR